MAKRENRYCPSGQCRGTTQPHRVEGETHTCQTCGNVKRQAPAALRGQSGPLPRAQGFRQAPTWVAGLDE